MSGPDFVLAVGGLAVGIPGLIDVCIRTGDSLVKKIDDFRHTSELLSRYRILGIDVREGVLHNSLQTVKQAERNRLVPDDVLARLRDILQSTTSAQEAALRRINEIDPNSSWHKFKIAFLRGKSRLQACYDEYKTIKDELDEVCSQIHREQMGTRSTFLPPDYFKVKHETEHSPPPARLRLSDILLVDGNYSDRRNGAAGDRMVGKFILESKSRENDMKYISQTLDKDKPSLPGGVPRCLGYRQPMYNDRVTGDPIYELVLELSIQPPVAPAGAAVPTYRSLSDVINNEPAPPFPARIQLAKRVCNTVIGAHSLGIVHKAIRSRSILLSNWANMPPGAAIPAAPPAGLPFDVLLLDWVYIRKTSGATSMSGGERYWHQMIYQHPNRQGGPGHNIEEAFEVKHDIYSLGVVLLEILLWRPFIQEAPVAAAHPANPAQPGIIGSILNYVGVGTAQAAIAPPIGPPAGPGPRIGDCFEQRALRLGPPNGGVPSDFAGDSVRLASLPNATRNVWLSLAREDLHSVNALASDIVVRCLQEHYASASDVLPDLEAT